MRIVHLPFYDDNPYQSLLMDAQRSLGHEVLQGGGGGNFAGIAWREWRADILHFHWLHPYLLREGAVASISRASRFLAEVALLKRRGARIAWTIHNLVNHNAKHSGIERAFSTLFGKLADSCFVHSQAAAVAASKRFSIDPGKIHTIPHGNYIGAYPNELEPEDARQQLGIPRDAMVFLFLGRIEPYKGIFELIQSFEKCPDNCHLVIAGKVADSSLLARLQACVRDKPRIHLHPQRIPDTEVQVYFNCADVVAFPFRNILTSGSIVLAMSFGKAVVAPRLPALEEILPEAGVRWFDADGSQPDLLEAMTMWLAEDAKLGGSQNRMAAEDWDWTGIALRLIRAIPRTRQCQHDLELHT